MGLPDPGRSTRFGLQFAAMFNVMPAIRAILRLRDLSWPTKRARIRVEIDNAALHFVHDHAARTGARYLARQEIPR